MGRPRLYKTVEEMQIAIDKYFDDCDINGLPYTMSDLAIALGFDSRASLIDYQTYEDENDKPFFYSIKKAKTRCEANVERGLLTGKYNPTGAIFNLKNNYGWKDKQEIDANVDNDVHINIEFTDE